MIRRFAASKVFSARGLAWRFATITPIAMPALSPTMEQGKVVEWVKKVGDSIGSGDTWCRVETDKAAVTFDNVSEEGFIARILIENGETVPVGTPICLIVDEEADVASDEVKNWKAGGTTASSTAAAAAGGDAAAPQMSAAGAGAGAPAATSQGISAAPASSSGSRVFASPLARKTAKELGVDVSLVQGTGGSVGRVTADDVILAAEQGVGKAQAAPSAAAAAGASGGAQPASPPQAAAAPAQPAPAPPIVTTAAFEDIPVSGMRATIAKRLTQSKNIDVPHYYESNDCRADNMTALIKHLNVKGNGKYKISVNDYLIKAIARANLIVPQCNTHWHGTYMRQYAAVDVSVAVATPSGLITPIIKNAHAKGLVEISSEMKALAAKAKDGTLEPHEFQGGTVTLSNLGGMATQSFTAIINPPQSTIVAAGTIVPRPEILKNADGEFEMTGKVETVINLTASFDHRVVDGAVGAEWFKHLKDAIENPMSLLL